MHPVIYIVGATSSGKSALAVAAARRWGGVIVNADAFQLYRGLEVLTAAPSAEERAGIPHRLYGVVSPAEEMNAARFAEMARAVLQEEAARGRGPLWVVGGSGLYLKALTHGLDDLPADPRLRAELARLPLAEKVARLRALDPSGAAATDLGNPRYVERALEISLLGGRPASELRRQFAAAPAGLRGLFLSWPREVLHARINGRVEEMFSRGALEEVAAVDASGSFSQTSLKTIGVREILDLLAGRIDRAEAVARVQQATRRYAKRQETWFRREGWLKSVCLQPPQRPESALPALEALLQSDA